MRVTMNSSVSGVGREGQTVEVKEDIGEMLIKNGRGRAAEDEAVEDEAAEDEAAEDDKPASRSRRPLGGNDTMVVPDSPATELS